MSKKSINGVNVGDTIRIVEMFNDPCSASYDGRTGTVTLIDDAGQLHGTWGGLAVIPEVDKFVVTKRKDE